MKMNRTVLAALMSATLMVTGATAHTVWLEPAGGDGDMHDTWRVRFGGHGGTLEQYDPAGLGAVDAFDAAGSRLEVNRDVDGEGVLLRVAAPPAVMTLHFDNGIHSRPPRGPSVPKPMDQVPGATRATRAVKYAKTIIEWSPQAVVVMGQPFEVIPVSDAAPKAGRPFRVRVLLDGAPVAGVKLGRGEEGGVDAPVTNSDGLAVFLPERGWNRLWAGKRIPVSGNRQYTELSYEYLLGFQAD